MQEIRADGRDPNLKDLQKMIRRAAKEKKDPVFGLILDPAKDVRNNSVQVDRRVPHSSDPSESSSSRLNARFKYFLCNGGHKLDKCERFSAKSSEEKSKSVRGR